ncbi:hypothetical protein MKW94_000052 [Papaver nudicaule]|uniref:S-protein homolog n=1 Tax=Papaver nudicaule TaxID=74823 RepID=A0AA42AUK7_PAPNU|nr:hypothetical protein [Papaver nudicaule]
MSKLSFLVLGSVTIFFTFLTLSLCYARSVDGETTQGYKPNWDVQYNKKTVTVQNDIDPNIPLKIHCWSSEDDLGEHTLYYKQIFIWRFYVNFWGSTSFSCDSSWYDPANGLMFKGFKAYNAKRDWVKHCVNDCRWSIRRDGGYYGDGTSQEPPFPPKKMFSYP